MTALIYKLEIFAVILILSLYASSDFIADTVTAWI